MKRNRFGRAGVTILVVLSVIAGLAVLFFFQSATGGVKTSQIQPTPSPTLNPTNNWEVLANLGYTVRYPKEAKAEAREEESLVLFIGPTQVASGRTQTELFDGYSFRIGMIESNPGLTLEEVSRIERDNAQTNCQVQEGGKVSQLKSVSINGNQGYQYSVEGCYVDYTETIISYKGELYRVSQSYVGNQEDQARYKETTYQILSTLKFNN